jgi:hypothetical protein
MRQGIRLYWSGIRHPQTQGKVEHFHGALQRTLDRRGTLPSELQPWLDAFRREHNHVRLHEALAMQAPHHSLATQFTPLSTRSTALGVSGGSLAAQNRLPREARSEGKKVAHQQSAFRRIRPDRSPVTTPDGLLLFHRAARN